MSVERVFFITRSNANDVTSDPGNSFFALRALQKEFAEVTYCGPLKETRSLAQIVHNLLARKLSSVKRYLAPHNQVNAKGYAKQLAPRLREKPYDFIFSLSPIAIAYLETDIPIFLFTDATLKNLEGYYPEFINVHKGSLKSGHAMERTSLGRCSRLFYTSEWARQSAVRDYGVPAERTSVLTRGANFVGGNDEETVRKWIAARSKEEVRLLFVGTNYPRKGGPIAVDAAAELNRRGIPTRLTFVGCKLPPEVEALDFVHSEGFLSKQKPEEEQKLRALFESAHFFVLPTRAECNAIVFLEACSFGLPVLSTDTGGVGTAVIDGVTGQLFPFDAKGAAYADAIQTLMANPEKYEALALSAYKKYAAEFNWTYVTKTIRAAAESLLA